MRVLACSIALIGLACGPNVSAADKPAPGKSADEHEGVVLFLTDGPEVEHYWIGLEAHPLSAAQRKEFQVDDDQGLLIEEVTPDSPAAKAGLEARDILLKAGKKPLKQIADLSGAIQEAKDQPLRLEIKRDGKLQTIAVTPVKRPSGNFNFRLVNPEIRLGDSNTAPAEKSKANGAVRKALNYLQAREGESERSGDEDAKMREQVKALLARRHELQQNMKRQNELLRSLSNAKNPDLATAEITRAEMRAAEEQIEAINRQTVMLELRQGNPDRQKLIRQLMTLRQCANELAEVGRTEEASHLGSAAHEIEERLQAIDQEIRRSATTPAFAQPDQEQVRLAQIRTAIQLLGQNGLPEDAERIRQRVERYRARATAAARDGRRPSRPAVPGPCDRRSSRTGRANAARDGGIEGSHRANEPTKGLTESPAQNRRGPSPSAERFCEGFQVSGPFPALRP